MPTQRGIGPAGVAIHDQVELAGGRVDDQAVYRDVFGHQRVAADGTDGVAYAVVHVVEAFQPAVQVDAGTAQRADGVGADAAFLCVGQNAGRVDGAHAAVVVGNDAHFFGAQFVHGHQQAAHHRTPLVGDQCAGILDQLGVAVFQAHGLGQQLD